MREKEGKGCLKGCLIVFAVIAVIIIVLLGIGLIILTSTKKIDKADCVSEVSLITSEEAVMFLIDPNPNSVDLPEGHYLTCIDDSYGVDKYEYCKIHHASNIVLEMPLGSTVHITGRVKGTVPSSSWTFNRQKILYFEAVANKQKVWIPEQTMVSFYTPELNNSQNEQVLVQLGFHRPSFDTPIYVSKLETNWECGRY